MDQVDADTQAGRLGQKTAETEPAAEGLLALGQFQEAFPDDKVCAEHLFKLRWPDGFVCRGCEGRQAWRLATRADTFECASCGNQTSIKAGTLMHGSRLPLKVWFWAAHLVSTTEDPVPVRQFQKLLGINSYKAAFELRRTLLYLANEAAAEELEDRQPQVPLPPRCIKPLEGQVEVNRREISDYPAFHRLERRKVVIAVVVEVAALAEQGSYSLGRMRLATIDDSSSQSIAAFVRANVKPGTTLFTDGHSAYRELTEYHLDSRWHGKRLPNTERVFAAMYGWFKSDIRDLTREAIDRGLEYVRAGFTPQTPQLAQPVTFETLLRLALQDAAG